MLLASLLSVSARSQTSSVAMSFTTASPLPSGTVGVGYSQTIAVTGGTAPYVWSITAGALPSGLALSSATGAIGGTPTSAGSFTFTVQVTDSAAATASQAYTLAVSSPGSPLSIVTASPLPSGTAGATYSQWLAAAGGKLPYSWSVSNGALPSGLTLNSATGAISGTPKSAVTFTFTIRVTDSAGAMASQVYTLTVILPGSPLTIATASPLSSGTVGVGYSQTIAVTGGTAPYVWSITAGALPSGLALSSATGAIGGTPSSAGSFALTVRVTDSAAATASQAYTLTVSTAGLSLTGSIAQVASGGGWDTTLTLVNTGASAGEALLNFLGNDGNPLQLPFVISQIPLPAVSLVASALDQPLNANSMLVLDSQQLSNRGPQVGSARLLTNGKVGGFAIFRYSPTGQEAVVPLETRDAPSYVLAFDNTGVLATGVALASVATQPANIPVVIRDDTGRQIGTDAINLAGQGHTSFMLTDHYGITKGKRGSVEFLSGHITALGLRANGSALTTLPVLANVTAGGGSMAQVASGGGWQTTFTLVNTGTSAAQAQLNFFDNNGNALSLPVTLVQSGNVITATTITQQIAAGAALVVLSQGSNTGPAVVGSAQLTTDGNVGGFAIFRYNPTGQEAVVPLEVRNASGYVLAFDNTNGLATGIALSNITNRAVSVPVVLNDDTGTTLVTTTINLAALGHTSFMLQDSYASVAGKRGTVEFDNPVGAQISVLGLRATPTGAVTTIPVLAK